MKKNESIYGENQMIDRRNKTKKYEQLRKISMVKVCELIQFYVGIPYAICCVIKDAPKAENYFWCPTCARG